MNYSLLFRFFVKHYSDAIIQAAYLALLNRDPDEEGRAAYEKALKTAGDLEVIIRDIAASKESWEKHFFEHPEELVRLVFRGLLGREPEPEALATYTTEFDEKKDLAAVLAAVDQSQEHWERLLGMKSEELVKAVYQALFGRDPAEEEVVLSVGEFKREGSLMALLTRLTRTDEAWRKQIEWRADDVVHAAYRGVLGRDADPAGLEEYAYSLKKSGDMVPLFQGLAGSEEHRNRTQTEFNILKRANTINAMESYVLIGIELPAFLPYVLAIAELINKNTGLKTVLFSTTSSALVFSAKLFSPAIIDVVSTESFIATLRCGVKRPRYVLIHPFCDNTHFSTVVNLLPDIELLLYADGPTNFVNNHHYLERQPKGVVCFGYSQLHDCGGFVLSTRPIIGLVPWSYVYDQYRRISETVKKLQPTPPPVKATTMLFLRYWQAGRYNMPVEVIVHALTNLLAEHVFFGDVLVIKHDSRGHPGILANILNVARASGIVALSYDEYLKSWGYVDVDPAAPFELFLDPCMLDKVDRYLVLDSSMPITLPYALKYFGFQRQIKVISGIRSSNFPAWVAEKNRGKVSEFSIHYQKTFVDLFSGDGIAIEKLEGEHYWQATIDLSNFNTTAVDNEKFDIDRFYALPVLALNVIFLPSPEWLSFCLALAQDLWKDERLSSLFVMPNGMKIEVPKYDGVFGKIELDDLDRAVRFGKLNVARVYVHSYGWTADVFRLKNLFPRSSYCYYADGFKNEVKRPVNGTQLTEIAYWGFCPFDWSIPARVLSFSDWRHALGVAMRPRRPEIQEIEADILVCLRYYGNGPYCFELEDVLEVFWQSVQPVIKHGARILLKGDVRHPTLLPRVLTYFSERHDGVVEDVASVVGDWAAKPLEWLLELGVLSKVSAYVVFDSSLSYILAHHPAKKNDAKIAVGASLEAFGQVIPAIVGETSHEEQVAQEQGVAERSIEAGIKGIRFYTERYVNQLAREGFSFKKLSDALYLVDLASPAKPDALQLEGSLMIPAQGGN